DDDSVGGAGSVTLAGNVVLGASVIIDTEDDNDAAGGAIDLTNAVVSANGVGFDLTLSTATAAGGANGGNVSLGAFGNSIGGEYVNDLLIDTTPGALGTAGILTLNGDIFLDDSDGTGTGGTAASFTLTGVTDVRL